MPFSSRNLLVGEILPRAIPVRSLIRHSTSVILRSFSQLVSWSSLVLIETSGLENPTRYSRFSVVPPSSCKPHLRPERERDNWGACYLSPSWLLHPLHEAFCFAGSSAPRRRIAPPVAHSCYTARAPHIKAAHGPLANQTRAPVRTGATPTADRHARIRIGSISYNRGNAREAGRGTHTLPGSPIRRSRCGPLQRLAVDGAWAVATRDARQVTTDLLATST